MATSPLEFCVLGVGHLAAAVRTQLPLFGLTVAEADEHAARRVILACSDYESASSFADANRRAVRDGYAILFAWITSGRIEVGPLVVPLESPCFECRVAQRRDFSLSHRPPCLGSGSPPATLNPDSRLWSLAQLGALLVAREACALRLAAPEARLTGRVAKFDPPCIFPEIIEFGRRADCAVCGRVAEAIPAIVPLRSPPGSAR